MLYVSFPTASAATTPGLFLFRRASRIYPLYWFCCAVVVGFWAFGLASRVMSVSVIVESALLLPNPNTLIGVSWTLSYEVYFYLIFAAALISRSLVASAVITVLAIISPRHCNGLLTQFYRPGVLLWPRLGVCLV